MYHVYVLLTAEVEYLSFCARGVTKKTFIGEKNYGRITDFFFTQGPPMLRRTRVSAILE
jgi:hypothetical protein